MYKNLRKNSNKNELIIGLSSIVFITLYGYYYPDIFIPAIISLQTFTLLRFIIRLGQNIPYMEFLTLYSVFDTLLMPLVGYKIYNEQNSLALLWGKYMRVSEDIYFSYMIPANLIFMISISLYSSNNNSENIKLIYAKMKNCLLDKGDIGIFFILLGYSAKIVIPYIPSAFAHLFGLLSWLRLVGPVYLFFSNHKFRLPIFAATIIAYLGEAALHGMFGDITMYLGLLGLILIVNYQIKLTTKFSFIFIIAFMVLTLQSVKGVYREITWNGIEREGLSVNGEKSSTEIFNTLFINRLQNPEKIFNEFALFGFFVRMNQGFLISQVMNYVPNVEDYAHGSTIIRAVGGVLLPRFIWPDKPISGGEENMRRFMGFKGKITYSMNIGPYGEAYGNFGSFYGLLFIFTYGWLLSYLFYFCLRLCHFYPSLLAWFPILFFYTLTVETDILTTLNSFLKTAIFIFLIYKIFPLLTNRSV